MNILSQFKKAIFYFPNTNTDSFADKNKQTVALIENRIS